MQFTKFAKSIRDFYVVQTRKDDEITFVFADGTFGNIPNGSYRTFYRQSANRSMRISPEDLTDINLSIDYVSATGKLETLTLGLELKDVVTNASITETSASIRNNAPKLITHKIE